MDGNNGNHTRRRRPPLPNIRPDGRLHEPVSGIQSTIGARERMAADPPRAQADNRQISSSVPIVSAPCPRPATNNLPTGRRPLPTLRQASSRARGHGIDNHYPPISTRGSIGMNSETFEHAFPQERTGTGRIIPRTGYPSSCPWDDSVEEEPETIYDTKTSLNRPLQHSSSMQMHVQTAPVSGASTPLMEHPRLNLASSGTTSVSSRQIAEGNQANTPSRRYALTAPRQPGNNHRRGSASMGSIVTTGAPQISNQVPNNQRRIPAVRAAPATSARSSTNGRANSSTHPSQSSNTLPNSRRTNVQMSGALSDRSTTSAATTGVQGRYVLDRYQPTISNGYRYNQQLSARDRARLNQMDFNTRNSLATGPTMTSIQTADATDDFGPLDWRDRRSVHPAALQTPQLPQQQDSSANTAVGLDRPVVRRNVQTRTQRRNHQRALQSGRVKPTTFHSFPKLPKELQLKIWKLLILGPRIIELKAVEVIEEVDEWSELSCERCIAQNDHPVLLHICSDSRYLAQQIYKLSFEDELKWPVYMDPDRDVLLFHDTRAIDVFASTCPRTDSTTPKSLEKIKYILIDPRGVRSPLGKRDLRGVQYDYPAYRLEEIAATYGSLKEIVVLKFDQSMHFRSIPPTLAAPYLSYMAANNGYTSVMETHLQMLLRLSIQQQYHARCQALARRNRLNPPPGHSNNPLNDHLSLTYQTQLTALAASRYPAGPWGHGPQAGSHASAIPGGNQVNPATANANDSIPSPPWKIPKVTAMTLEDVKKRMERGEPKEEDLASEFESLLCR
ncbi:hypothetical protein L207DRAFT_617436 [Hyaloscypha variabilis F]|uniref:2EXR domain-containing protein n=1 Tax=Hyaloscypha variabilis (strain UAMH 11265 / GT02V1 / F) TaxID=1149755 RepID=A0A2J6S4K1_HYAVF|nr:hypothetical protein L207DRAFT_617436 [Hyaloscypha variabilis F]